MASKLIEIFNALKTKRKYVVYDIAQKYCDLAEQRIKQFLQEQITLFFK